jgi:hypothetical protein
MKETTSIAARHAAEENSDGCDASATSSALPPELVEATAREAARDTDFVGRLLHELGVVRSSDLQLAGPGSYLPTARAVKGGATARS